MKLTIYIGLNMLTAYTIIWEEEGPSSAPANLYNVSGSDGISLL